MDNAKRIPVGFYKPNPSIGMNDQGARLSVASRKLQSIHLPVSRQNRDRAALDEARPYLSIAFTDGEGSVIEVQALREFREMTLRITV
jgi:hypothetical protein